jgi:hypothetical protein
LSVQPPWNKASRAGFERRAAKLQQPLWLKVALLAYARVGANGHANFARGELEVLFDQKRQNIDRAIRKAITEDWLQEESCSECLLPPADFIEMSFGNSQQVCRIHPPLREIKRGPGETAGQTGQVESLSDGFCITERCKSLSSSDSSEAVSV